MNDFLNTQESRKNNRTKNIVAVIVAVVSFIVVFLAAFFTTRYLTSSFFSKAKNDLVTDEMKNQVAEMNQQLPQIIEEGVAKEAIVQNLRTNRGKMRFFIDNNITLYYYYYDKNKKVVTEIEIAPSLYK